MRKAIFCQRANSSGHLQVKSKNGNYKASSGGLAQHPGCACPAVQDTHVVKDGGICLWLGHAFLSLLQPGGVISSLALLQADISA